MPVLQIVIASTRTGRTGPQVADWFAGQARAHGGFEARLADLAEIALPFLDEPEHPSTRDYRNQHTKDWSALVDGADAFVFVTPEYNAGFTAPLKNAIDHLYHEWAYKPVAFVSYGMSSAGLRAVQMLKQVVTALRMVPAVESVIIPLRQYLDEDGVLRPTGTLASAATGTLDELLRLTDALAPLRATLPA